MGNTRGKNVRFCRDNCENKVSDFDRERERFFGRLPEKENLQKFGLPPAAGLLPKKRTGVGHFIPWQMDDY